MVGPRNVKARLASIYSCHLHPSTNSSWRDYGLVEASARGSPLQLARLACWGHRQRRLTIQAVNSSLPHLYPRRHLSLYYSLLPLRPQAPSTLGHKSSSPPAGPFPVLPLSHTHLCLHPQSPPCRVQRTNRSLQLSVLLLPAETFVALSETDTHFSLPTHLPIFFYPRHLISFYPLLLHYPRPPNL